MPNWTANTLTVDGPRKALNKCILDLALAAVKTSEAEEPLTLKKVLREEAYFTFNAFKEVPKDLNVFDYWVGTNKKKDFVPMPDLEAYALEQYGTTDTLRLERALVEKYGTSGWMEWCSTNWGTKWDACSPEVTERSEEEIIFTFDSAWSPAHAATQAAAEKYPNLNFKLLYKNEGGEGAGIMEYEEGEEVRDSFLPAEPDQIRTDFVGFLVAVATMDETEIPRLLMAEIPDWYCEESYDIEGEDLMVVLRKRVEGLTFNPTFLVPSLRT